MLLVKQSYYSNKIKNYIILPSYICTLQQVKFIFSCTLSDRKTIYQLMSKPKFHKQTGSSHLIRYHFFNESEPDVDVPDGDVQFGKKMYNQMCAGCHNYIVLGPSLISIYGMRGARQKAFTNYSSKTKALKDVKWSKERIFKMLECPEQMFGFQSSMTFDGVQDPYVRASIIQYLQFMRLTNPQAVKPKEHIYT